MKATPAAVSVVTNSLALAALIGAAALTDSARLIVFTASPVRSDNSRTLMFSRPRAARSWAPVGWSAGFLRGGLIINLTLLTQFELVDSS